MDEPDDSAPKGSSVSPKVRAVSHTHWDSGKKRECCELPANLTGNASKTQLHQGAADL